VLDGGENYFVEAVLCPIRVGRIEKNDREACGGENPRKN
jgi:hypothetical protein